MRVAPPIVLIEQNLALERSSPTTLLPSEIKNIKNKRYSKKSAVCKPKIHRILTSK